MRQQEPRHNLVISFATQNMFALLSPVTLSIRASLVPTSLASLASVNSRLFLRRCAGAYDVKAETAA